MQKMLIIAAFVMMATAVGRAEIEAVGEQDRLVVASLNPIATDLARQVGGEDVVIVELMRPGQNPHAYTPSPGDLQNARNAQLFLAMGKHLENYLEDLKNSLGAHQRVLEIGRMIPSLKMSSENALPACCPAHAHGSVDPHWWHSIRNMQRAARILADAFSETDPDRSDAYRTRSRAFIERLEELERWASQEVSRIPRRDRKLATAHAAFNYFCDEFGFEPIAVKGLTTKEEPAPSHLALIADKIRADGVRAVFPEISANQKLLTSMARETGVRIGRPLYAGSPSPDEPTYEAMVRHNINAIVEALAPME